MCFIIQSQCTVCITQAFLILYSDALISGALLIMEAPKDKHLTCPSPFPMQAHQPRAQIMLSPIRLSHLGPLFFCRHHPRARFQTTPDLPSAPVFRSHSNQPILNLVTLPAPPSLTPSLLPSLLPSFLQKPQGLWLTFSPHLLCLLTHPGRTQVFPGLTPRVGCAPALRNKLSSHLLASLCLNNNKIYIS